MKFNLLGSLLGFALFSLAAVAQTPTSDQLSALKGLPQDQQDQLQGALGRSSDGSDRKTDPRLQMPDTIRQKKGETEELDDFDRPPPRVRDKSSDGRPLRIYDENPEIVPEDTLLIDLRPIERRRRLSQDSSTTSASGVGTNALSAPQRPVTTKEAEDDRKDKEDARSYARDPYDDKPITDEQKERLEDFRQRVLKNNPYKLNKFGVLEIPGLPSIPVAGLTAEEADRADER